MPTTPEFAKCKALIEEQNSQLSIACGLAQHLVQAAQLLREGHARLHAEHRALCICLDESGLLPASEVQAQASVQRAVLLMRRVMSSDRAMIRIGVFAGLKEIGCFNRLFGKYDVSKGRTVPLCRGHVMKSIRRKCGASEGYFSDVSGSEESISRSGTVGNMAKMTMSSMSSLSGGMNKTGRSGMTRQLSMDPESVSEHPQLERTGTGMSSWNRTTLTSLKKSVGTLSVFSRKSDRSLVPTLNPLPPEAGTEPSELKDGGKNDGETNESDGGRSSPASSMSRHTSKKSAKMQPASRSRSPIPQAASSQDGSIIDAKRRGRGRGATREGQRVLAIKMHKQYLLESRMYGADRNPGACSWEDVARNSWLAPMMCRAFGITGSCRLSASSRTLKQFLNRSLHSLASSLPQVFVIGGIISDSSPVATTDRYNPAANRWERLESCLQYARTGCTAVAARGSIYAIGGHDGMKSLANCERFDLRTCEWDTRDRPPKMSTPRCNGPADVIDDSIYVIDGLEWKQRESSHTIRCECFHFQKNSWSPWTFEPATVAITAAATLRGRLYVAGMEEGHLKVLPVGDDATVETARSSNDKLFFRKRGATIEMSSTRSGDDASLDKHLVCEYYDPQTGKSGIMSRNPNPPFKELLGATSFGDRLYFFGQQLKQVCILSIVSGEWEEIQSQLPLRVRTIKTVSSGDSAAQLLCFGQFVDKEGKNSQSQRLASRWVMLPPYQVGREGSSIVLVRS